MTKQIIAAVVAALILFIWQFLSWSLLNVHGAENQYTPNQDEILEVLEENLEEGQYFLPTVPPGASQEEYQAAMEAGIGKPWATINYHPKMEMNMGVNLLRGFAVDFLSAWFLVWILMQFASRTLVKTLLTSLAVGAIGYLTINYPQAIWFEVSTIGFIVDTIVQWGAVGLWLGWYLNR